MRRVRQMQSKAGFTLIELLVVIAIIGILAAIAIPQFAAYRRRGFIADVKSNLKNAATAEEAYFVDENAYKSGALSSGTPPGFNLSDDVNITATVGTDKFTLVGTHDNCPAGNKWTYKSEGGVIDDTSDCE